MKLVASAGPNIQPTMKLRSYKFSMSHELDFFDTGSEHLSGLALFPHVSMYPCMTLVTKKR